MPNFCEENKGSLRSTGFPISSAGLLGLNDSLRVRPTCQPEKYKQLTAKAQQNQNQNQTDVHKDVRIFVSFWGWTGPVL